jgi:hypothetical protein
MKQSVKVWFAATILTVAFTSSAAATPAASTTRASWIDAIAGWFERMSWSWAREEGAGSRNDRNELTSPEGGSKHGSWTTPDGRPVPPPPGAGGSSGG